MKLFFSSLFSLLFFACSNTVPSDGDMDGFYVSGNSPTPPASSSSNSSSSSSYFSSSLSSKDSIFQWVNIPGKNFQMTKTEVTQEQYAKFGKLPEQKLTGKNLPVANVSWYAAALFCNEVARYYQMDSAYSYSAVNASNEIIDLKENLEAISVRLPTEEEWEYAARGGTDTRFYFGDSNPSDYANYNSAGVVAVGSYLPNLYGLYDMAGNVAEWTTSWYPRGVSSGSRKIVRGGSFSSGTSALASGESDDANVSSAIYSRGFRLIRKK